MDLSKYNNKHNPFYANRSKKQKQKKESINLKQSFYNTVHWKRLRDQALRSSPMCYRCEIRGYIKEATVVDHIISFTSKNDPMATDTDNLKPLCHKCHAQIGYEENTKKYEWRDRYDNGESIESIAQEKYRKVQDVVGDDGYYV